MKTFLNIFTVTIGVGILLAGIIWINEILGSKMRLRKAKQQQVETNLKTSDEQIQKINLPRLSQILNETSRSMDRSALSTKVMKQRSQRLESVALQHPLGAKVYALKCLACHGVVGEGKTTLKNFKTRLQRRSIPYETPPLLAKNVSTSPNAFIDLASKKNSPHLTPTGLEALDLTTVKALHQYVQELVK